MRLKTLIHEPAYDRVLDILLGTAKTNGFEFAEPTPLISPFWKTTFTPSSSEVIFRHLDRSANSANKLYTIQPCIRINDLPHINDGWHCLLFHMVSFFLLDVNSIEDAVAVILKALVKASNLSPSDFYFTVPTNQYCPDNSSQQSLGADLLEKIGVSSEQMIWCGGSDNYQDNSLVTAEGHEVSMTGPKVEIFVKPPNQNRLYEVGTCVLETAKLADASFGNVFACAIGLERLVSISERKTSIFELQEHQEMRSLLCNSLLHDSLAKSSLGKDAVEKTILMIDALFIISPLIKDKKYDRGITNHYRRVVRELGRTLKSLGIHWNDITKMISQEVNIDLQSKIDIKFVAEQVKLALTGYV